MASQNDELPDWERLLAAERHLQHLVPGAVLVGGTAAAIHAVLPRALRPPWNDWQHLVARGRHWAQIVARVVLESES